LIQNGLPLLSLRAANAEGYRSVGTPRLPPVPSRNRGQHASFLALRVAEVEQQLAAVRDQVLPHGSGMLITAVGQDLENSKVNGQLRDRASGTDVVTAREGRAIVHALNGLGALTAKINAYATEETRGGKPQYQDLVARMDTIEVATIEDLSLGEIDPSVFDDERILVEIWMPGGRQLTDDRRDALDEAVREFAAIDQPRSAGRTGEPVIPVYRGPERDVHLVLTTGANLKLLPTLLPSAVEVHRAPHVNLIALAEAADEAGEIVPVELPEPTAAAVALHDSGITQDHPYLQPILLGASSVVPGAPSPMDSADGHGTQIGGVAAYSRLAAGLTAGRLIPDAWLVSVRLLETKADAGGDPDRGPLWAERTTESIGMAEALAPQRPIVHNMSIGADNEGFEAASRTAWSVAVDVLAWNSGSGRPLVIAAGNAEPITDRNNYPYVNLGPPYLQQPGQAWNALTVGGYTDLDQLTAQDLERGYPVPLAVAGTLSPHSRTAPGGNHPLKPDLVMEAGNTAPGGSLDNPDAQGLTVLTLDSKWRQGTLLRRSCMTSPAAAAASNALARIANAHPTLRPATWRGLLVHTTSWPQAAKGQFLNKSDLLRSFGYGVPAPERGMASDSNRPVMIHEGVIRPSHRNAKRKPERLADFIELPLPYQELDELAETPVTLAVTLSYFIEPTDNLTRRAYAGGRLRWDLQGPTEDADGFRARINELAREQGYLRGGGSFDWEIGTAVRSRGTLQHDRTQVAASQIAGPRLLAVYPVTGWWEDRAATYERKLPYSVVVSVDLGDADVDLYALTAITLQPISVDIDLDS
jgi:Subtilase family